MFPLLITELIGPAVQGTTGILTAIQSNTPKGAVRRVVVTSSVAAILSTVTEPTVFTEVSYILRFPPILSSTNFHSPHKPLFLSRKG